MEHFVINIGRQVGSGGKSIGEILARRLGVSLYDKQLINIAARESGLDTEFFERADEQQARRTTSAFATLVSYLRSPFSYGGNGDNILSNDALFKLQSDVIRRIAERESAIFVGRCADYILRDHPRMLNIFLTAPEADRVARIRSRSGCGEAEARALMARTDAGRAAYYNYYSPLTWGAAATYHLSVDSSVLGDERTADYILRYAARKLDLKIPEL